MQSKTANQPADAYVFDQAAQITATEDRKSFTLWWDPRGFDPSEGTTVVCLHGPAGWAMREFETVHPGLKDGGRALLFVQWWYGKNDSSSGHAPAKEIYRWIEGELEKRRVGGGKVVLLSADPALGAAVSKLDRKRFFRASVSSAEEAAGA